MGARGRTHPSFGMTPTFWEYDLRSQKTQILKSRCHTKRRMGAAARAHPSFGMTTTKTLRSVFSWRMSYFYSQNNPGAVILLGKTNMFRFNHPAQAAKLRKELKDSNVNLTRLSSLGQSMSDLQRSTENLALLTSGWVNKNIIVDNK